MLIEYQRHPPNASLSLLPPFPQEQLRQQRSELQNTQRDLFQREAELGMWVCWLPLLLDCWCPAPLLAARNC